MAEQVHRNIYRIQVPLPGNPLKSLNSYVIKGERNLIVDSGFNQPECLEVMEAGLEEIGVCLERTDFFVTHLHADHLGLVGRLARDGSARLYFSRPDAERLAQERLWEEMLGYAEEVGFPSQELRSALAEHPGHKYAASGLPPFSYLGDEDLLEYGGYRFRCLETPGHTRGHLCLYEPQQKLLISGDHILGDITPHIELWSEHGNTLESYLASLDKIGLLEVDLVLPGHRSVFSDCSGRIAQIKEHHRVRAGEAVSALRDGPLDAYRVAQRMRWDLKFDRWESLPVAQRWFATGEALAHLKYVQEQGLVRRVLREGKVYFEACGNC